MLQQVYNTARGTARVQQEYSKRYSKFIRYSLLILLILLIQENTWSLSAPCILFFFIAILFLKTIKLKTGEKPVSSLGPVDLSSSGGLRLPGAFINEVI